MVVAMVANSLLGLAARVGLRAVRVGWSHLQFVVWPRAWGLHVAGPYPSTGPNRGCVYRTRFIVGPVEVRVWREAPDGEGRRVTVHKVRA